MNRLHALLTRTPLAARVIPFVIFVLLTASQELVGPAGRYWVYLIRSLAGAALLVATWSVVQEMRWNFSWEAVLVGVAVFVMWAGLDDFLVHLGFTNSYPKWGGGGGPWNPFSQFGNGSTLAWFFIAVRIAGSTLVVPALEEVFFRSFVYRYIQKVDFLSVPLGAFVWRPFLFASVFFAFEHREWLAGLLCGFAYQGLVCWKNRLGDAMTAHAITNCLLGLWVVWREEWRFW